MVWAVRIIHAVYCIYVVTEIVPIVTGSESPGPNILIADTMMVMLVDGWQKEEDTLNTCLHTSGPLVTQDAEGIVAICPQILPVLESIYDIL